ncbi:MAG: tRNA (adenosine(37)-N6)-threonylcarbamoyltransferase complex transferase subunit TsaD [Spirochaetaceae bacterium]|jgi:N6-L-threonylcarbamoyladenine synthase|nr:tRNA (adenosine(37)-N6)-threonylcarbamoyltransferase complex transferase subunit TsaD [Spirochaetaceae bacterium]
MFVLGIESSCDECSAAIVEDGKKILSNVVATQIPFHAAYNGVVPEIASRKHIEWINAVVSKALSDAALSVEDIQAVAASAEPGLLGSLLVGLCFAKGFAWARKLPFIAVNHMLAHLYASKLEPANAETASPPPEYPFLGLLVSGGHSIIARVDDFDDITVLGTTVDDAVGEAFDKVAKFYEIGYPGGLVIDKLAQKGDAKAYHFPLPEIRASRYDVSYSGLKTAVTREPWKFTNAYNPPPAYNNTPPLAGRVGGGVAGRAALNSTDLANLAASFQKTAIDILIRSLLRAVEDTGLRTIVAGGGVAANSYLRSELARHSDIRCIFPPLPLCGDNGAMVAGIAYQYLQRGETSPLSLTASARVAGYKHRH